ncbi:MAG: M3 family metallopeptidase [Thermodesulfobacteriota bacterium]
MTSEHRSYIESTRRSAGPTQKLVEKSFSASYPALGSYAQSAFDKRWIDWAPREGKRPGGFCTGSLLTKESRIFMTYNETLGDVLTLAHEAGHAFHSHVMSDIGLTRTSTR